MGKPLFTTIHPATGGGFDAVETGVAREVATVDNPFSVMVSGTFVATILIEVSPDGTNWAPFGAGVTAPGTVKVDIPCKQVRARCSAFTSGLAVVWLMAKNSTDDDES
jgi:hypothetical protein